MKISILVEGKTENVFMPHLRCYLERSLAGKMPNLDPVPCDGRIPTGEKLRRVVGLLLNDRSRPADHVIALTDVYTGTQPPDFRDAAHAKAQMRQWVGEEPRFHPHAAQHDFEAWLLPYWPTIRQLARSDLGAPAGDPESVNHIHPPAHRIKELFSVGRGRRHYNKPRDAARILRDNDLSVAIARCSELKAFVNTILKTCGAPLVQ